MSGVIMLDGLIRRVEVSVEVKESIDNSMAEVIKKRYEDEIKNNKNKRDSDRQPIIDEIERLQDVLEALDASFYEREEEIEKIGDAYKGCCLHKEVAVIYGRGYFKEFFKRIEKCKTCDTVLSDVEVTKDEYIESTGDKCEYSPRNFLSEISSGQPPIVMTNLYEE